MSQAPRVVESNSQVAEKLTSERTQRIRAAIRILTEYLQKIAYQAERGQTNTKVRGLGDIDNK